MDHTADVGVIAYGSSMKQTFSNAAKALLSLMIKPEDVREVLYRDVEVIAPDEGSLLVEWLNELIYLFDAENVVFRRFNITELNETRLKARCYGEKIDISRHKLKMGVKAAAYHMLKIEKKDGDYRVQVLLDI